MAPKKEMNAFDILCIERELQGLVGGYFEKAYQPTRNEVLLRFRVPGEGRTDVAIGLGRYVLWTARARENPTELPQFSQQLRKYLTGGRVVAVRQHAFDRVLVFEIGKADEMYQLVAECFANGNVVLVKDGTIVMPLIHKTWAHREIRPGRVWSFPAARLDPKVATAAEFMEALRRSDKDLVRTLSSLGNLGPVYAEEVCARAGVDKKTAIGELDTATLARVVDAVRALIREVTESPQPGVLRDAEGTAVDASPVPLQVHEGRARVPTSTLSEALDEVFQPRLREVTVQDDRLKEVEATRARLARQVADIRARSEAFAADERVARLSGDLLYAHFMDVEELLTRSREVHRKGGWTGLSDAALRVGAARVREVRRDGGAIILELPDAEGVGRAVEVQLMKGLAENAQSHYEIAKQMRLKQEGASVALAQGEREMEQLEAKGDSIVHRIEAVQARRITAPTKQFWFERFRWFVASPGNLVVAGRDAKSNDQIVKKHLDDGDRYLHADIQGAPSVVVKPHEGRISDAALDEGAQFAVAFSKAWISGVGRGEAYWVTPPQVTRTPESGEFLPRGAFVIRGERQFIRTEVRCAVGECDVEGHRKVMGGPVAAVQARSARYIVLEPGRLQLGSLSSLLAREFNVPVEEVQRVLPPGPVRIVGSKGLSEAALGEAKG